MRNTGFCLKKQFHKKAFASVLAIMLVFFIVNVYFAIAPVKACAAQTDVKMKKCLLLIGDSRTCALAYLLDEDPKWQIIYNYQEEGIVRRIYYKDGIGIVLCGEGGGKYENGAFERTCESMFDVMSTNASVMNANEYVLYNLFGVNDVLTKSEKNTTWAEKYVKADEELMERLGERCTRAYQFNAGPIFEDGYMCTKRGLKNEDIEKFNEKYVETERVKIVDLYNYLIESGLGDFLAAPDDSGLHYPLSTDERILNYILSFEKG